MGITYIREAVNFGSMENGHMEQEVKSVRERLIDAGIDELNRNGLDDFSVRRVAAACGVSCAAPYRHFENKDDFIAAVIQHTHDLWYIQQERIITAHPGSAREQILYICRAYIQFLLDNPYFRSVIMSKDASFDAAHLKLKSSLSDTTHRIVVKYCQEVNMPDRAAKIKLFIVRSILYGAALMIDNGEVSNTPEVMDAIINIIDREFDLPWDGMEKA